MKNFGLNMLYPRLAACLFLNLNLQIQNVKKIVNMVYEGKLPVEYFIQLSKKMIPNILKTRRVLLPRRYKAWIEAFGDLSERDYQTYMELFEHMKRMMKLPDLMIYLRKSVPSLIAQIQKRGREYEKTMQIDYLRDLNERYEEFIFNQYEGRVLVIESDGMDFESNMEDFRKIVNKIDAELFGLFRAENF